jgi:hypothetical protein
MSINRTDLQRFAISAIGALLLSATCIVSAVGPARAAERAPAIAGALQPIDG